MSKKVLVTGASGFIGSHLCELLVSQGFDVKAFVHYNSKSSWGWLEDSYVKDEIEVVLGDVRDFDSVLNSMQNCKAVFHLAALIGIPYSYRSPLAYLKTNVEGTYNILQSAKTLNLDNVIITSTSETYGTAQFVPITELHPLVGQSPYSASKIGSDQLAISYYRSFGLPVKIVRPFNTYGPRQSARAIIPTVITQALSGKKLIKLGNLHPTRDLTFVRDTANGFVAIYRSDQLYGEVVNIGMNYEISVKNIVELIRSLSGTNFNVEVDQERIRPQNSEVERLFCDNSKLKEATDWQPSYNLEKGLVETIEFISQNISMYKSDLYHV